MRILACLLLCLTHVVAHAAAPTWEELNDRAKALYGERRYDEAAAALRQALAVAEAQNGPDDASVAQSLNNLALVYKMQQRYDEAEALYRRGMSIADRTLRDDDPRRMKSTEDLARLLVATGRHAEAEPLYLRAIEWAQDHHGLQGGSVADLEMALSGIYVKLGRAGDGDRLARRSMASMGVAARASGAVARPPDTYSDVQKTAAMEIDLARLIFESDADHCISGALGDEFRLSFWVWQAANLELATRAGRVLGALPAAQRDALQDRVQKRKRPGVAPNDALCGVLSRSAREGKADLRVLYPAQSRALDAVDTGDEKLRLEKRDADLGVGCVKQIYNSGGRGFDAMRERCECRTRAIKANASDAQIDAWLADLPDSKHSGSDAGVAATLQRDWVPKALAAAAECDTAAP